MNTRLVRFASASVILLAVSPLAAQVPQIINFQGRVSVQNIPYQGLGQFKFALVNTDGTVTFWSNDGTSATGSEPVAAVGIVVDSGLYNVKLGDASLPHMLPIPSTVFTNSDVRLRVWFDDGRNGSQQLAPDQRITSVG